MVTEAPLSQRDIEHEIYGFVGPIDEDGDYPALDKGFALETYGAIPFNEVAGLTIGELLQLQQAAANIEYATGPDIPDGQRQQALETYAPHITRRWVRYSLSLDDLFAKLRPQLATLKGVDEERFSRDRVMTEILVGRDVKYSKDFFRDMKAIIDEETGQPRYSTQDIKNMCAASWGDYQLQFTDDQYEVLCDLRERYDGYQSSGNHYSHEEIVRRLKAEVPFDDERTVEYTPADNNPRTLDLANYAHIGRYDSNELDSNDLPAVARDTIEFEKRIGQNIAGGLRHLNGEFVEVKTLINMLDIRQENGAFPPMLKFKTFAEFQDHLTTLSPKEQRSFAGMTTLEEVYEHVVEHFLYEALDVVVAASGTIGNLIDMEVMSEVDIENETYAALEARLEYAKAAEIIQAILQDHGIDSAGSPIFILPSTLRPYVSQLRSMRGDVSPPENGAGPHMIDQELDTAAVYAAFEPQILASAAEHHLISA